jgi:ribose-phosphate pyrophosphokinase
MCSFGNQYKLPPEEDGKQIQERRAVRLQVFSGTANPALAQKIAGALEMELGHVAIDRFPDGEVFVKFVQNIRGADVFIIQPTCRPPNENLMELLIMLDAARRASAARITAVLPFFGYARQDRKDQPRVPITAKLVANLLVTAGAHRVLAMDLHAQQIQGFFDIPVDHLYAAPVLIKHVRQVVNGEAVVVAPDSGGVKMAHAYAGMMDASLAIVAKRRISAEKVSTLHLVGDVEGRDCVLVDDLTTTAGTLIAAAEKLKASGAARIFAAVTHCCLTEDACDKLEKSEITELVTTDTVPLNVPCGKSSKIRVLSVAGLLAEAVRRIHEDRSVSSLFRL